MPSLPNASTKSPLIADLKTLYHLIKPTRGNTHEERLESFYGGQAEQYDRFRQRLLHGRESLYQQLTKQPLPEPQPLNLSSGNSGDNTSQNAGHIWIDCGGGTGATFESIQPALPNFEQIFIVDLCDSLLDIARDRITQNHWTNVTPTRSDITQFTPPNGPVSIITFSYALTMMPNWFAAIDWAYQWLQPGGYIGVVDFFIAHKHPAAYQTYQSWLARNFWQLWFAADNVFLSADHSAYLHHRFTPISHTETCGKVPYLFGLKAPYYQFIGQKAP
ncbi:MAG: class I SAM-dependent methyltransferase [Cyanobacteria bacterium J06621_3]